MEKKNKGNFLKYFIFKQTKKVDFAFSLSIFNYGFLRKLIKTDKNKRHF